MPIRIRLALSFALVTCVLFGIGGLLFARSFRSGLEKSLEPGLRAQAGAIANDLERIDPTTELSGSGPVGAISTRDLVAQVLTPSGRVEAATQEAGRRPVLSRATIVRAARGDVFANAEVGPEPEPFRVVATSTTTSAGRRVVLVATSLEPTNEAVARVHDGLLIGGASAIVLAGLGGWFLAAAALRPVERMRRETASISEHDATSRLDVPNTRDEIASLAKTMNDLLGRLQGVLARQREFVADASHELRTPIAILRTELELAGRPQRTPAELLDAVGHATHETERLVQLTEELLFLARSDGPTDEHLEGVPLGRLLERAVRDIKTRADARCVRMELQQEQELRIVIDPEHIRRGVDNMLANALRYSPAGSTLTLRVRAAHDAVAIDVLDQGPGFPPAFLPHAFERFRRADEARSRGDGGTGLGLAIVLAVAEAHGGTATAANLPDGGAIVTMTIPRSHDGKM